MGETLYSLSTALQTAIDGGYIFDEETGEIIWEPDDIDALEIAVAEKAEACAIVRKNKIALADAIKAEEKALAERRKSLLSQAESLESYMVKCVELNGGVIETPKCRISIRHSDRVEVLDDTVIPEEYETVRITKQPNKIAIKKALKDGKEVAGCALVINKNIQVK